MQPSRPRAIRESPARYFINGNVCIPGLIFTFREDQVQVPGGEPGTASSPPANHP